MTEETKTVEVIEAPTFTETVEEPVKKTRKPRVKVRPTEELIEVPVKKLSDKEKDNLIEFLREQAIELTNKINAYKETTEASFRQTRKMEEDFKAMESYYKKQLNYIAVQLAAFQTAVEQATKGGVL